MSVALAQHRGARGVFPLHAYHTRETTVKHMSRHPTIGITKDAGTKPGETDAQPDHYASSVEKAGGTAQPIYYREDLSEVGAILDQVDAILFSGGNDLDPALYGQTWHPMAKPVDPNRQRWELALIEAADARRMPILGICLGCQLLNVHRGGSLIQFLPDLLRPTPIEHRKVHDVPLRHDVTIESESILAQTIGKPRISVNTYHKQAVDRVGRGLRITAHATDGIVEAIEDASMPLLIGVQWHPERISDEPEHRAIFELLVQRAAGK